MRRAAAAAQAPDKERAPSFEGALPFCKAFQPRLIPAASPGSLSQPPELPGGKLVSDYFFLVFLAGFFFAIFLFIIGLDLVAFLARFFITGIGTSSS
jgi:hypothetical protein